jgi:glycosyltransferase involved in cell wall biosynthesis
MLISILLPVKNESSYLSLCLDSIISQSETHFECLIVDDYSEDDTLSIIKEYADKDKRIQYFSNDQPGVIGALAMAFSQSSGELITRMDGDDLMPEHKLETLKSTLLEAGPQHCATAHVEYFSDEGLSAGFINYAKWLNSLCEHNSHEQQLFKECVVASANWMAFKKDLIDMKAFVDSQYPEDYHLVFKMFEHQMKIVSSSKVTHRWRDHALRASRVSKLYEDNKFYKLKLDFFTKFYGTENLIVWGAGPSGKHFAKELIARVIPFTWVAVNEKKIGQRIYGVEIMPYQIIKDRLDDNLIITVSQKNAMTEIYQYLEEIGFVNYFEF